MRCKTADQSVISSFLCRLSQQSLPHPSSGGRRCCVLSIRDAQKHTQTLNPNVCAIDRSYFWHILICHICNVCKGGYSVQGLHVYRVSTLAKDRRQTLLLIGFLKCHTISCHIKSN